MSTQRTYGGIVRYLHSNDESTRHAIQVIVGLVVFPIDIQGIYHSGVLMNMKGVRLADARKV